MTLTTFTLENGVRFGLEAAVINTRDTWSAPHGTILIDAASSGGDENLFCAVMPLWCNQPHHHSSHVLSVYEMV